MRTQKTLLVTMLALLVSIVHADEIIKPYEGRPRVHYKEAGKVVGRFAFVYGKIVRVGHSRRVHFLNFENGRGAFTGIVFSDQLDAFPETLESLYENKFVELSGWVSTYAGTPQIVLSSPSQVRVLDTLPDLSPWQEPAPRKVGSKLKIASLNMYNLFDEVDDPFRNDQGTRAKPREELEAIAGMIRSLDADVLALQEVESRGYLQRFVDVFLPDQGYEVVHYEGNDIRGIDVCLLSRLPVGAVTSYRHATFAGPDGKPRRFSRDLLAVSIEPENADPFEVWVLHLKSNYDGKEHAEPLRVAEARFVRERLDRALSHGRRDIVLCGDFNDEWGSRTLSTIVGEGEKAMVNLAADVPDDKRITYNKEPYRSMIDFILVSPSMAEHFVDESFKIADGTVESHGSDHNPVMAVFKLKK